MKRFAAVASALVALVVAAGPHAVLSAPSLPNDQGFTKQWGLQKIHAVQAWAFSRGSGIVVAVVDTGVDAKHPDLSGHILRGYNFVDNNTDASDVKGHGTHVAGIVAALTNNYVGVASVAPDSRILPVRVLGSNGEGDPGNVARGIAWAVAHDAKVINLSLAQDDNNEGAIPQDSVLHDNRVDQAINDAARRGATVVVAAGNSDAGGQAKTSYRASSPGVIVVGASTRTDRRAAYSNYGDGLDVLAPGGGSATDPKSCSDPDWIVSTWWNPTAKKSEYGGGCGTSMAVAHVSGIAALLMARGLSNAETVRRIISTAVHLGSSSGRDPQSGFGRVDAFRAVVSVKETTTGAAGTTKPASSFDGTAATPAVAPHRGEDDPRTLAASPRVFRAQSRQLPLAFASILVLSMAFVHRRRFMRVILRRI